MTMPRRVRRSVSVSKGAASEPGFGVADPIECVERELEVARRRRHVLQHAIVEGDEPHAVALLVREVEERGGQEPPVVQLRDGARAEAHGCRHVERHHAVGVRVGLELLDVVAVGPGEHAPVHAAQVVAGLVAAVLGEVEREAHVRRAVEAVDEAVHHRARHQFEVAHPRQGGRVHELRAAHGGSRTAPVHRYIPDFGAGTASSSRSMI